MKINVITVKTSADFYATHKAPNDIIRILKDKFGAKSTLIGFSENSNSFFTKIIKRIKFTYEFVKTRLKNEIVILQFPMYETTSLLNKFFLFNMKFLNKNKTIVLIHDIDGIRSQDSNLYKQELARLSKVNYIIVHNSKMKSKLLSDGVNSKMYLLNLFDYLCEYDNEVRDNNISKNPVVVYAGNLSKQKSPFIHQLDYKKMKFTLNIYGVGINSNLNKKIIYMDKYSADVLPNKLDGDLGLIWDGNFDESDENDGMKNYTRFNNPHKLSCYMAAGIPVIVWKKAAISDFVLKNNIGYIIENIYDINKLDFSDYDIKLSNVRKIQKNVRNGFYTEYVVNKVLNDIGDKK